MSERRVVITGMGSISGLGGDTKTFWEGLLAGRSGVSNVTLFDTSEYPVHIGAEVKDFDPTSVIDAKAVKRLDRVAQFGICAADEAVRDAGLDLDSLDMDRAGVIVGTGIGGLAVFQDQTERMLNKGPRRVSPFFIPMMMANAVPGQISIHFGFRGPNFATVSACASANHAMGSALESIRRDESDLVVTGGAEAALTRVGLAGFAALKALSTRNDDPQTASRPFDAERDGFVMGEGAGILVFEELEHAKARGAMIYAEVVGFGMNADAYHVTAPDPDGTGGAKAMRQALKDAKANPEDVTYINAHGTSTSLNDKIETAVMKAVLGDHARSVVVSSTKSMVGHLLGGAGGVELIASVLSIHHGVVHPTINLVNPDPDCDLDYVPEGAREMDVDLALSNSLGFGGHNATVAVRKFV